MARIEVRSHRQRRIDNVTVEPPMKAVRGSKWSRWMTPIPKNYLSGCCDCGLQHWMDFRLDKDGDVQFRVARANHYTKLARRSRPYVKS